MSIERPRYTVEQRFGRVEIRSYESYMVASTTVRGSMERAGNSGFGILARYIFGGNVSGDGSSTKIAMTSPVTQVRAEERFVVRFMVPSEFSAESVPTPTDARVILEEVGPQRLAALRYSGRWSKSSYDHRLGELRRTLDVAELSSEGEPIWARYDPPWKPWFLRHNEVLLAVA
jgi:hypothetical protein